MLIVKCPHCNESVIIEQINCAIFRHGVYKINNDQIDPHMNREACEELVKNDLIYGCGKPFQIVNNEAIICDYI
jgi:hypothetical protein